jgi:hypothetical protein
MKIKYPSPRHRRWNAFSAWDIPSSKNPGHVYLRRFTIIQTPACSVLVHRIFEPDDGRWPHDHPWTWFRTFVLRGGYLADEYKNYKAFCNDQVQHGVHNAWSSYRMNFWQAHQIMYVQPGTWTLVITGKRIRKFCFWTPERKVRYDKMGVN